ncbi:MAG: hypothetical protein AAFY71_04530 [Bacteroidota bacterium]
MKAATIRDLKAELKHRDEDELMELCLRLAKFKKDNKELLTYLLFEAENEWLYIEGVKKDIEEMFGEINHTSFYLVKKGIRKVLRHVKKCIRYSGKKETEVELLFYFCLQVKELGGYLKRSTILQRLYFRQVQMINKAIDKLHEDLQFDFQQRMGELAL